MISDHGKRHASANPSKLENGTKEEGGEGQGRESPGQGKAPPKMYKPFHYLAMVYMKDQNTNKRLAHGWMDGYTP